MIHAARALGLRVMLGCMVESQLAVAPAVQIASLADWVDLDGHLLLAEQPYVGPRAGRRPRAAVGRPGPGGPRGMSVARRASASAAPASVREEQLAIFAEGLFALHSAKTAHGVIRYGARDVVAVIDSTEAGRTAAEVVPFALEGRADRRDAAPRPSSAARPRC